jgi:hypothetical protein
MPLHQQSKIIKNKNVTKLRNNQAEAEIYNSVAGIHNYHVKGKNGVYFSPFAEASWCEKYRDKYFPNIARHLLTLGGEWACLPFGHSKHDAEHHGYGSNQDWQIIDQNDDRITLEIEYPSAHVIHSLKREISLDNITGALNISLEIKARHACTLPIGLHPIFRIPTGNAPLKITPPKFLKCASAPQSIALKDSQIEQATIIEQNETIWNNIKQLNGEELIQAWQTNGEITLHYPDENFDVVMRWDEQDLPHCLFWIANPGLTDFPLGKGFTAIGIEPTSSFFDNTQLAAKFASKYRLEDVQFGTKLSPDKLWKTNYQIICIEHL